MTGPSLDFYGTVHLIDWIASPIGQVKGLRGRVKIVDDESAVGFRARGSGSANWLAQIAGDSETWHLFGCQVRAVTEHGEDAPSMVDTFEVP